MELIFGETIDTGEKFPCPSNGFLLVIVSKRPVAQHLKERVVVAIFADLFQVVVLATGTDAFLAVDGSENLWGCMP